MSSGFGIGGGGNACVGIAITIGKRGSEEVDYCFISWVRAFFRDGSEGGTAGDKCSVDFDLVLPDQVFDGLVGRLGELAELLKLLVARVAFESP